MLLTCPPEGDEDGESRRDRGLQSSENEPVDEDASIVVACGRAHDDDTPKEDGRTEDSRCREALAKGDHGSGSAEVTHVEDHGRVRVALVVGDGGTVVCVTDDDGETQVAVEVELSGRGHETLVPALEGVGDHHEGDDPVVQMSNCSVKEMNEGSPEVKFSNETLLGDGINHLVTLLVILELVPLDVRDLVVLCGSHWGDMV